LRIDVTIDGLEGQQHEDLEGDEREAGCGGATGRGRAGAPVARTHECQQNHGNRERHKNCGNDAVESGVRGGLEPVGVAALELRAPEHNIEVIGDGREIAIDGRGSERLELLMNLRHAIGHHAEGNEVFAHVLRLQIPLPQSFHQDLGILREHIGARGGEEVQHALGHLGPDAVDDLQILRGRVHDPRERAVVVREQSRHRVTHVLDAQRGHQLAFGSFGIKTLEEAWITGRQIEAARQAITRHMKREGQLWIRIFPDKPVTKKPAEVRMGKGKGDPEIWVAVIRPGKIIFELGGVSEQVAREALRLADSKLGLKTMFVARRAG